MCRPPAPDDIARRARRQAVRAFEWVGRAGVATDGGLAWLEDGEVCDDLYSGTAGVLFGCAEAAAAGLDTGPVARAALTRLLHIVEEPASCSLPDDGLFSGWAGVAVALRAWATPSASDDAAAGAAAATARVAERVLRAPPDDAGYTDLISGCAGILLALVTAEAAAAPADTAVTDAAHVLADTLLRMARPDPHGLHWRMYAEYERLTPGFSHGTAGVAYALAVAGRRLHRPDLSEAATRGADALLALGHTPHGWALPLSVPRQSHRPEVFYGWCHGPAGTVRLFALLDALDPQPRWRSAIEACLRAMLTSGLPARRYPGFWDNVGRCCGTAGVGRLVLERHLATGEQHLLDWADTLATDVMDRALELPHGIAWSNTEHTATPPDLAPEPGLMQGAAGIAGWLTMLAACHDEQDAPATTAAALTGVVPGWL